MMSMNLISHICFLVSLLFFVISGVIFLTMDVHRGWHILLGKPLKYSEGQRQRDKARRKSIEAKKKKADIATAELTKKIQTKDLIKRISGEEATTVLNQSDEEATSVLVENEGSEATTVLQTSFDEESTTILGVNMDSEATTVLRTDGDQEVTTVLGTEMGSDVTTVLGAHYEAEETTVLFETHEGAGNFRIIYEITQCSVSE